VSSIAATRVAAGLSQPVFVGAPPGDLGRLLVVEKAGRIKILDLASGQVLAAPFLDVGTEISAAGEGGLLGLAFHPDFATNGFFYVNLINTSGDTEIRRYQLSADPNRADPASSALVIRIDQPTETNHKAGWLGFGPDGYLYAAFGDGGGADDPLGAGQDINTLLGKMLRLDVDSDAFPGDATRNYAIPADNPFVGSAPLDEIWALGLRNPWRPSFDRGLGQLFIADVGQNSFEEINLTELWIMDNGTPRGAIQLGQTGGWDLLAAGNFNRDGFEDLLWRNTASGATELWAMNDSAVQGAIRPGDRSGWNAVSTGDVNRDGTDDLVWLDPASGAVEIWLLQNAALQKVCPVFPPRRARASSQPAISMPTAATISSGDTAATAR
jgi:hypothetical protein